MRGLEQFCGAFEKVETWGSGNTYFTKSKSHVRWLEIGQHVKGEMHYESAATEQTGADPHYGHSVPAAHPQFWIYTTNPLPLEGKGRLETSLLMLLQHASTLLFC